MEAQTEVTQSSVCGITWVSRSLDSNWLTCNICRKMEAGGCMCECFCRKQPKPWGGTSEAEIENYYTETSLRLESHAYGPTLYPLIVETNSAHRSASWGEG
jgi:hypothetical protein